MNLEKREIQNFIIWYLPAIIINYFISGSLLFSERGSVSFGFQLDFLASHVAAFICAIWLFLNSRKHGLNRWLWGIFGLGSHLFGVVLYFGYVAFNKRVEPKP
jgi:hypothetical protein